MCILFLVTNNIYVCPSLYRLGRGTGLLNPGQIGYRTGTEIVKGILIFVLCYSNMQYVFSKFLCYLRCILQSCV